MPTSHSCILLLGTFCEGGPGRARRRGRAGGPGWGTPGFQGLWARGHQHQKATCHPEGGAGVRRGLVPELCRWKNLPWRDPLLPSNKPPRTPRPFPLAMQTKGFWLQTTCVDRKGWASAWGSARPLVPDPDPSFAVRDNFWEFGPSSGSGPRTYVIRSEEQTFGVRPVHWIRAPNISFSP